MSDEEEEDFGKKPLKAKDLDESEEEEDENGKEENDEEEEPELSFDEIRAAITKYGEKRPKGMQAILDQHGVKNVKALEKKEARWEAVYKSTMAAIKAAKK